jgi:hypothetical protein
MPLKKRWKCAEPAYAERCEQFGANVSEERVKGTSTGFALRLAVHASLRASRLRRGFLQPLVKWMQFIPMGTKRAGEGCRRG